ncbi:MAG: HAD family hydrolase [Syntrophales bacterium]|nr:HAD family hydrolase [Syntrophales bacterium]
MKLSGIIFDFDGTLATLKVDFDRMKKEVNKCIEAYGIPTENLQGKYILEMVEGGVEILSNRNEEVARQFKEEAFHIIESIEISSASSAEPLPGVPEMLTYLKVRGLKTAVVTRNCYAAVMLSFPSLNLLVDTILTRDHVRPVKPNPNHLKMALATIGVRPNEAAMVGDHPMDMAMGKREGLMAIGVLSGASRREDLELAGADFIFDTAAELTNLLDRTGGLLLL